MNGDLPDDPTMRVRHVRPPCRHDRASLIRAAYNARKAPLQPDDEWAFGEGVRAGIEAVAAADRKSEAEACDTNPSTSAPPSPVAALTDLLADLTASDETGWTARLSRHNDGAWLLSVDCDREPLGRHVAGLLLGEDTGGRAVDSDLVWSGYHDEGDEPMHIRVLARCDDRPEGAAR